VVSTADALDVSPLVAAADWDALAALRAQSRAHGVEGVMLKHRRAGYGSGRRKQGDPDGPAWWTWKVDPLTVDCVLVYAQAGHGRRASVHNDYTFAVWSRPPTDAAEAQAAVEAIARREPARPGALRLVAFAKACSGLSDAEFAEVDRTVRATTLEKFGPVRSVRPTLVFELAFEGIGASPRHKSGLAVRFPRLLRIRGDSMVKAGILPDDFVVVRPQDTAADGEIVVALVGEEATVKRFFRESDHIRLQPENATMEPIRTTDVQVMGRVVGLFRSV